MLLDQRGQALGRGPGVKANLDKLLSVKENIFEGVVNMTLYDDALEAKATCAHCLGHLEGVLHFTPDYLSARDREERIKDARRQITAKIQREHKCIARVDADKLPVADFLRRFE